MTASNGTNVHPLAMSAFSNVGTSGLYDRARPSYPSEFVDAILDKVPSGQKFNVVELGSGTGIFTRVLLSRPRAQQDLESLVAVEPAPGMRESFDQTVTSKVKDGLKVSCVDGAFDRIPVSDGHADLIIAAQAFHWIGREKANADRVMREIARVLRPKTGVLALIWNLEDREAAGWVAQVREAYEAHEQDTPQYRHGYWRVIYETEAYKTLFDSANKSDKTVSRFVPTTVQGVKDRCASKSYISDLSEAEREQVLDFVGKAAEKGDGKQWIDEKEGTFGYPYRTDLVLIPIAK